MVDRDTLFALSSGRLPAAIAVVRISGPSARYGVEALAGRLPEPRRASLAKLRAPGQDDVLDEALVLWLPGPRSETGEDMAELHLHGGPAVVAGVLAALGRLADFRPAEPGEFTRRAFDNGRLDLTAVEGLADLIFAETEAQRRQAFHQLKGVLAEHAEAWRRRLIEALALVEARIDFSDQDVPDDLIAPALAIARELHRDIARALADDRRGERLREGLIVAIAGPPNVGKSSLLNRIARREAAIVSPYAGTTRDVIEVHLNLDGFPVTILDTAGIHETDDPIEREGVRRARERAAAADLVLWVREAGSQSQKAEPKYGLGGQNPTMWLIENKIDLVDSDSKQNLFSEKSAQNRFLLSVLTGFGLDALLSAIADYARTAFDQSEPALVTRQRHRSALMETQEALTRAIAEAAIGREDIMAEELRLATRGLGRLTGRTDVEEVLDVIFRDFCIGK